MEIGFVNGNQEGTGAVENQLRKMIPSGYLTQPWYRWPIEIDGLPIKNGGSFHGYVSHNQIVFKSFGL